MLEANQELCPRRKADCIKFFMQLQTTKQYYLHFSISPLITQHCSRNPDPITHGFRFAITQQRNGATGFYKQQKPRFLLQINLIAHFVQLITYRLLHNANGYRSRYPSFRTDLSIFTDQLRSFAKQKHRRPRLPAHFLFTKGHHHLLRRFDDPFSLWKKVGRTYLLLPAASSSCSGCTYCLFPRRRP